MIRWQKGSSGELENCENKIAVNTNKIESDPPDQPTDSFYLPGWDLMSPVTHFHLLRANFQFRQLKVSLPYVLIFY